MCISRGLCSGITIAATNGHEKQECLSLQCSHRTRLSPGKARGVGERVHPRATRPVRGWQPARLCSGGCQMNLYDRRQRQEVDQLVEDFTQNGLSRREFMKRAVAIGFSASAAGALLAACGGSSVATNVKPVAVLNGWGGDEQASFKAVVAPFTQQTGITVNVDSTRDLDATLTTRIQGNNPPGVAILPNPAKMQQLASQKHLIALDGFLDMNSIKSQYAPGWISLGTYQNKFYALFYKAANKATVWYSPNQFQANGYQTPATWDAMISLSNQIAGSGKYPWSMGVESGAASGWPATDWVAQIFLNES